MAALSGIYGRLVRMGREPALIRCKLAQSMKDDEYIAFIEDDVHTHGEGFRISAFVPKRVVRVEIEPAPAQNLPGEGWLAVAMLYRNGREMIVELPGEPIMTGNRISVRREAVQPVQESHRVSAGARRSRR